MRNLLPPPGTLRKATAFAFAVLLLLCLLAAVIWRVTAGRLDTQVTRTVESEVYVTQLRVETVGREATVAYLRGFFTPEKTEDSRQNLIMLLADENYHTLAGNLAVWPTEVGENLGTLTIPIVWQGRKTQARVIHRVLSDGSHLLYGREITDFLSARRSFFIAFLAISVPLTLTVLLLGYLIRRSLLNEIQSIGHAAQEIISGNLTERVSTPHDDGELQLLSSTINHMLDHIETLIEGMTNVSNEIAHELRTPLAQVRARIERLMEKTSEDSVVSSELKAALKDIDTLIRTFNALMRLAQIEARSRQSGFRLVDLPEVIAETAEFYQHAAEAKHINLKATIPESLTIQADPSLVAQAVANLIDNAIKHTPAGGRIEIALEPCGASGAIVRVDDTGRGIPEAELPLVTDRFYRGLANRDERGAGLGLSLVAAIASLHGGALTLANSNPGFRAALGLQTGANLAGSAAR